MGFQFDLDKIKALSNFSKKDSKELRENYESDAKFENHSIFEPFIPAKEEPISKLKFGTKGQVTVSSENNTDPLDTHDTKTMFAWNASISRLAYA